MQASSHHFIPLADQTNHGSSQPSQSPTIASTSHRPSRNHLWVSSYRSPTQPDAAARPLHFGGTSYHCTDDNVRSPSTSISSLNESCPLSQMSAYEVAHHNPLFQLDPNLPARQQQRNVPMDERFEYSIVSTPTSTTPEAQPSQQLETVASRYDWQPPLGPNGPKNTGRATKGKGKGKGYRGKRKQRGTTGGSQTQHTISQGNSMTFAHIHALDEFVVDNIIDYQSCTNEKFKITDKAACSDLQEQINDDPDMQKLIQKRLTGDYLYHHINYLMKNYINPISDVLEKSGMNWNEVEHKIEAGDEQWDEWQASGIFVDRIRNHPFPLYFKFKEALNFKSANSDNAVNFFLEEAESNFPSQQETVEVTSSLSRKRRHEGNAKYRREEEEEEDEEDEEDEEGIRSRPVPRRDAEQSFLDRDQAIIGILDKLANIIAIRNDKMTESRRRADDVNIVARFLEDDGQISDVQRDKILSKCLESRSVLNDMVVLAKDPNGRVRRIILDKVLK